MELWEAILLAAFTGIGGFFSNQILHNLAVKKDNIQVNRDRLLLNIYQVDNFIKSLTELEHIRKELKRIRELKESSDTDLELLSEETNRIREEIDDLDDESNKHDDPNELIDVKTKIRSLSKELAEITIELKEHKIQNQILIDDIDLYEKILSDLNKRKYSEDVISALFLIDPTGEIVDDFTELANLYLDPESLTTSNKRVLQLRLKIERFLNKKISTFK
jgi:DNA-directed RNA polymerase beta' subunit